MVRSSNFLNISYVSNHNAHLPEMFHEFALVLTTMCIIVGQRTNGIQANVAICTCSSATCYNELQEIKYTCTCCMGSLSHCTDMPKSQRIGCVIPHCYLQRWITQPILRIFWHICSSGTVKSHSCAMFLLNRLGSNCELRYRWTASTDTSSSPLVSNALTRCTGRFLHSSFILSGRPDKNNVSLL